MPLRASIRRGSYGWITRRDTNLNGNGFISHMPSSATLWHTGPMEIGVDEGELLRRIGVGDEAALVALHRQYANLVFSMALYIVRDHATAEEVTQDVFLAIWRRAASYEAVRGTVATWLLTITRRRAIDYERRRAVRPPSVDVTATETLSLNDAVFDAEQFDVRQALEQLPPEQRQILQLLYFRGLTHQEVAEHLTVPIGTVKSRVRLAMERLRRILLLLVVLG